MNVTHYLVDISALVRLLTRPEIVHEWEGPVTAGLVGICPVTELEFLYSARSREDHIDKTRRLNQLFPSVFIPDGVYGRAAKVQEELTSRGQHRSAGAVDLLLAATAELTGTTLLHGDRDFECVAAVTGQPVQWLSGP
ncbi:PIN domain nuclease [Spiractinospora alimapuensis]|uniref:PIN domain nuclease n=1 Tax=Spiractinospora alimapuensis TaxID=2820884 RepID=UPI001F28F294|nr:PIN domain nuclease [Spiractinospora alimapuensis]QVQ53291.1 PIN domain nuclease [Spiractinospora alimapuensis]